MISYALQSSEFDGSTARAIAWSPELGLFVAAGGVGAGTIATSTDGITWTTQTSPFSGSAQASSVVWAQGLFVAGASGSGTDGGIATSPDGITWTLQSTPWDSSPHVTAIAASPTLFVACRFIGTQRLMTSPDGVTWTEQTTPFDAQSIWVVGWSDQLGLFLAGGDPGPEVLMTSPDGVTWTAQTTPLDGGQLIGVGDSVIVGGAIALGNDSTGAVTLITSTDGSTWTAQSTPFDSAGGHATAVADNGASLIVASGQDATGAITIATSPDGIVWTANASPFDNIGFADTVVYAPELALSVIAGGASGPVIASGSLDTFTPPDEPPPVNSGPGGGGLRFPVPIPWRILVVNLETLAVLACIDPIASGRQITHILNYPWIGGCVVPSDDIRINHPHDDGKPVVTKNRRGLIFLRRDGTTTPWRPRGSLVILQTQDDADSDRAQTTISAFGPDKLWDGQPVVINDTGDLITDTNGYGFTGTPGNAIAMQLISDSIAGYLVRNPTHTAGRAACRIDWGPDNGGTAFWTGTIETTGAIDIKFQQGAMLGPSLRELIATGSFDIVIRPIFDQVNRPGYLAEGSIVAQAGADRPGAVFSWDTPPNSVIKLSRLDDGSPGQLVNLAQFYAGIGGRGGTADLESDPTSIDAYGEMWQITFWPGQEVVAAVQSLAQLLISLAKNGKTIVTITPAWGRGPVPLSGYGLGDRCPVYTSKRFREPIEGELVRVLGIPFDLDQGETVTQLLTSADGTGA